MRTLAVIPIAIVVAACAATTPRAVDPTPAMLPATYDFEIRYGAAHLPGELALARDSIAVRTKIAKCSRIPVPTTERRRHFSCQGLEDVEDLRVIIDPVRPVSDARWQGVVVRMVTSTRCVEYGPAERGEKGACLRTQQRTEAARESASGQLVISTAPHR